MGNENVRTHSPLLLRSLPLRIALVIVLLLGALAAPGVARFAVAAADSRPSVLLIDGALGDGELAELEWLGDGAQTVGEENGFVLQTTADPAWWTATESVGQAPATFMLRPTGDTAVSAEMIVWALDQIREYGASVQTFAIGVGPSGLLLQSYVEDLASTPQSSRADIVGLALLGVPTNGYSTIEQYPENKVWEVLAGSAGLAVDDLKAGSGFLEDLNRSAFPNIVKTLVVTGNVGDLAYGATDGAGVSLDFAVDSSVSTQVESVYANATVSRYLNLSGNWEPFISSIDYPGRSVDRSLQERLSAMESYELSDEVRSLVQNFYVAWFQGGSPVTHNAAALLMDASGSMNDGVGGGGTKLAAAKEAADQYLLAMQSYEELPQSPPMEVNILAFNESVTTVTEDYTAAGMDAVNGISASGETNIGEALSQALAYLDSAPAGATKHVLLLSDGESTRGMSDQQMLEGPVADAASRGIVVDTIGFGDIGESDASFLQTVSEQTGGSYLQAEDTYNLKIGFLRSYYDSLGVTLVEDSIPAGTRDMTVATVPAGTLALQAGIVGQGEAPAVELLLDGEAVDPSLYTVQQRSGLTSIQYVSPAGGEYSVRLDDDGQESHLFAVSQQGMGDGLNLVGEEPDYSLFILLGVIAVMVVAIVVVVILSTRRNRLVSPQPVPVTGIPATPADIPSADETGTPGVSANTPSTDESVRAFEADDPVEEPADQGNSTQDGAEGQPPAGTSHTSGDNA